MYLLTQFPIRRFRASCIFIWPDPVRASACPSRPPEPPQEGFTPLYVAASKNLRAVVAYLIEAGAQVEAANNVRGWGDGKRGGAEAQGRTQGASLLVHRGSCPLDVRATHLGPSRPFALR